MSRVLPVVVNDRESETRTPAHPLYRIPDDARDPLTACPPLPSLRAGEDDLTRLAPGRPQASGDAIVISGRVVDEGFRPVRRTLIEVWGANAHGRYSHLIDAGRNDSPLDPNFYGFGRLMTDDDGRYRVRTIKPGAYIARKDIAWWRPPHVHFSVGTSGASIRHGRVSLHRVRCAEVLLFGFEPSRATVQTQQSAANPHEPVKEHVALARRGPAARGLASGRRMPSAR